MPVTTEATRAQTAQAALARHAWQEAYDLLSEADGRGELAPDELELLAQASWWMGHLSSTIEVRERAYAAYMKAGDMGHAAVTAILVGRDYLLKNQQPVAGAWLNRAERLLAGAPENRGHGWLAITRAMAASVGGDYETAYEQATRANEIARTFGDPDLGALALNTMGICMVNDGRVAEGLRLIDEATVPAVAGEVGPETAGAVYCATIGTCTGLGEWTRAVQWTEAQDRWCKREHINGFPGMCRLHRAEIKRLNGSWLEAEAEARRATDELPGFLPAAVGSALYVIGLVRLRRGDLPAAEQALMQAHAQGRDPEPALSLLRLAQGKVDVASASIQRALDAPPRPTAWGLAPGTTLDRVTLLPARVEIAVAAGDTAAARAAADELTTLTGQFTSQAVRADAAWARGVVSLAEGDAHAAVPELEDAIRLWTELEVPYEGARARLALGQALIADGAADRAALELEAARAALERVGALLDLARAEQALVELTGDSGDAKHRAGAERAERAFLFTDIVDSTRFAELLGDEAWNDVIRWHDQALRSLIAEHAGQEIKRTGDGFFVAFDDPDAAIACAVAIQRRLAAQRKEQGFAPAVRIGLHWAEATRSGLDFIGQGVNEAARIAAEASGGEILASAAAMGGTRQEFIELGRHTASLKGIAEPVEIVSIDWRPS